MPATRKATRKATGKGAPNCSLIQKPMKPPRDMISAWAKLGNLANPYTSVSETAEMRYRLPVTAELIRIWGQFKFSHARGKICVNIADKSVM